MKRGLPTFKEGEEHVKISHFTRKGIDIDGLIHVGTNDWYEYEFYKKMGIFPLLGFEPLPEAVERARAKDPYIPIYQVALGEKDGQLGLHVANGDGQSSSGYMMLPTYREEFPDIRIIDYFNVPQARFDTWKMDHPGVRMGDYNCLVLDVEGMELEVLKGFGPYLSSIQYINVELSGTPTYYDAPSAADVVKFLKQQGFSQDSPIEPHNDVFFIRKSNPRTEEITV